MTHSEAEKLLEAFESRIVAVLKEHPAAWWVKNLGVSRGVVANKWINKVSKPNAETLLKILDLTGYSANWLFFGVGPKELASIDNSIGKDDKPPALLFFRLFPHEVQDFIRHAVRLSIEPGSNEATHFLTSTMSILINYMQKQRQQVQNTRMRLAGEHSEKQSKNLLVITVDPDWSLVYANERAFAKFDILDESAYGKSFALKTRNEDVNRFKAGLRGLSPSDTTINMRLCIELPDGSFEWQEWNFKAIYNNDGELLHIEALGLEIPENQIRKDTRSSG